MFRDILFWLGVTIIAVAVLILVAGDLCLRAALG